MLCSLQIDPVVILRFTPAGSDAIHNPIEGCGQRGQAFRLRDVRAHRSNSSLSERVSRGRAPADAKNLVTLTGQCGSERETDVTATDDQYAHDPQLIAMRARGKGAKRLCFPEHFLIASPGNGAPEV